MHDERGIAMVTALLVSMVVLTLSIALASLSLHNSTASGLDRKRLLAVNAAEAGIDVTFGMMQHPTAFAPLPCGTPVTGTLPSVTYSATVDYYAVYPPAGSPMTCPLLSNPAGAVITSTGMSPPGSARASIRKMQTLVRLAASGQGSSYLGAVYGGRSITITGSQGATISGFAANDANLNTPGPWTCGNNATIQGSVFAGSVSQSGGCDVSQDVWGNTTVGVSSGTSNPSTVGHDLISSTSTIALSGTAHVYGNATSGTTCSGCTTGGGGRVSGSVTTNHVSPAPPVPPFPTMGYNPADWTDKGFTIAPTQPNCPATKAFVLNPPTATDYVVRTGCDLQFNNNETMNLQGDLAIVTDGNVKANNNFIINSLDGQPHTLFLFVPVTTYPSACTAGNMDFGNQVTGTPAGTITISVYTPCDVKFTNATGINGQIIGGRDISITNDFRMGFAPIDIPGLVQTGGFNVDIAYFREIS